MLRRPLVAAGLTSLFVGLLVVLAPSAYADHCGQTPGVIEVGCHGGDDNGGGGGGGGGDDPCDYSWADPQPPPGTDGHTSGVGGAWYWQSCLLVSGPDWAMGSMRLVWLNDPPSPATIAWSILAAIDIKRPAIGIVPDPTAGNKGLVGLPVWLWTVNAMPYFGTRTDSDSARGLSITLTVRSTKIVWEMGDGNTVTCTSAGIRYEDHYGKSTPDGWCGHRYAKSSRNQPGGRYEITATTHWQATWNASNGESGVINRQLSSTTSVQIDELQVVIG
jgi:hypothetical protein